MEGIFESDLSRFWLLFLGHLVLLLPKRVNYLTFQYFHRAYMRKVIPETRCAH